MFSMQLSKRTYSQTQNISGVFHVDDEHINSEPGRLWLTLIIIISDFAIRIGLVMDILILLLILLIAHAPRRKYFLII